MKPGATVRPVASTTSKPGCRFRMRPHVLDATVRDEDVDVTLGRTKAVKDLGTYDNLFCH